jgi:hypothetical protein
MCAQLDVDDEKILADMYLPDLRNKFGTIHNQCKTNPARELFGTYDMRRHNDQLTVVLITVHYTAVIDKAKTAQIIVNGVCSPSISSLIAVG